MTAARKSSVSLAECFEALIRGEESTDASAAVHVLAELALKIRGALTPNG